MKDKINRLPLLLIAALFAAAAFIASAKGGAPDASTLKKAEYIYLEAANAYNDQRIDDYYMLLRRAHELSPDDPYIAGSLAEVELLMNTDSVTVERAYEAIRRRFEASPTEPAYYMAYSNMAAQLDRADDLIDLWSKLDSLLPDRTDPAMQLGLALIGRYSRTANNDDFDRGMAIFNRLESTVGPTLPITAQKVRAYSQRRDTTAIISSLEALATSAPKDVDANIFIGQVFDYLNIPDSVLFYYDRAEQADTTDGTVYLARADFFHNHGDSVAYDREVFRALRSQNIEFQQKFQLLRDYVVKLYADSLQRPRIEQMFETLLNVNPGEASVHGLYGGYKGEINDLHGAVEQFSYSLDLDPNQPDIWANLVKAYASLNDADNLLSASRRALQYNPGDAYFTLMGSFALGQKEEYGKGVALLDSVDVSTVDNSKALSAICSTKGDYLYKLGERDSAMAQYVKAIELDADNFMAMNNYAYYLAVDNKDLDRAELYASIATAADPENPTYLDTYAWVMFRKKDYAKARELIDRAIKAFSKEENGSENEEPIAEDGINTDEGDASAEIYSHAGDIYFMSGDHREAVDFWSKALKLEPDDALLKKKVEHRTFFYE